MQFQTICKVEDYMEALLNQEVVEQVAKYFYVSVKTVERI